MLRRAYQRYALLENHNVVGARHASPSLSAANEGVQFHIDDTLNDYENVGSAKTEWFGEAGEPARDSGFVGEVGGAEAFFQAGFFGEDEVGVIEHEDEECPD